MQFDFGIRSKTEGEQKDSKARNSRRRRLRRALCFFTLFCMFLSGCGSIILNGDLSFSAYAPVEPIPWERAEETMRETTFAYGSVDKYNLGGTRAFVTLPEHVNPADVPQLNQQISQYNETASREFQKKLYKGDFKIIDYFESPAGTASSSANRATDSVKRRFVYAYYTPCLKTATASENHAGYYPDNMLTALNVPKSGSAANFYIERPGSDAQVSGNALVLMSYDPYKKDYTVFFSEYISNEENEKNDSRCIAGRVGLGKGLAVDKAGEGIAVEKAANRNYFVFSNGFLYIFDENGNQIFATDYSGVISQKAREMNYRYGYKPYWRYTVTNVEIDDKGIPYFTLNMETSNESFAQADKNTDKIVDDADTAGDDLGGAESEEVGGVTYFHGTFSCLRINLGGLNGMDFHSSLSEGSLNILNAEERTVSAQYIDYDAVKKEVDDLENYTIDENGDRHYKKRIQTVEEVMADLRDNDGEALPDRDKYEPEDLVDAYMSLPEVKDVLENGFDGFHTRYGRDTYSLVGSAAGRTVQLYQMKEAGETGSQAVSENWLVNDKNAKLTGTTLLYDQMPMRWWWLYFNEDDFNDPYINSSSLQYDCGGRLAGFLQGSRYVLPTLRPGKYDGNDWAYYNIADYAEINGYYQVNNGGFVCGHSQPLVSSGMYKSLDRDVWYSNLKNELVKAASAQVYADDAGDLRINGGAVWGNVDKARYYYNNTLDNGFSLIHEAGRYTSSFRGNAQDTVVKAAGNKSYQTYDELVKYGGRVYLDHMLQKNVPVSLIRIDPLDAEDGSQRHYATFGNDNRNTYVLPTMIMTDTETVRLDHTWYLSAGSENYEIKSISANVTLPSRYRMVYPEGTYIQSTGDTWVGSMVKAGADDLPALNYYSVKGSKLASEAVWKSYFGLFYTRAWESDYPIYDNASNTRFNVLSDYGWFLRWYYYNNVFWDFYGGANSEKTFSTIQEQNLGKHGDIYDRMVPGEAVDLGIWQVGNKKIVAYFTDQVIRFYEPGGGPMYGTYRATRQISIDELRGITPGYILKEEDENAVSATSDAQEDKESAAKANEALTDDDAEFKLNASNILPVKEDLSQFIYFSTDGGMHLLYITDSLQADTTSSDGKTIDNSWRRRGRIMSMMEGSYSGVFQTGSQYKVVGFQTQEYSYSAADTCMAEVYDLNIGTMIRNHGVTAIEEYMKGLRNLYLTQTHTIRKSLDENGNQVVTIVQPDETEAEFKRAKTIMIGTLEAAEAELKDICVEFGMDTVPEASENLLSQLRSNYQQQRAALAELYTFLGIDSTKLEGNWRYLQFEGQMFNASYQRILEMTMVQIVLSDFYLDDQITPQTGGIAGLMGIHKYDPSVEEDGAPGLRFVYNDASASGNLIHLYDPETDEDAENNKTEAAGPGLTPLGLPIVTNFNKVLYVDEFYKYRVQYKRWQIDEAQKKIMESLSDDAAAEAANRDLAADKISETLENKMNDVMANDEDYQNLESRDFYQAIADALEDKYLTGLRLQEQERAGQETARTQAAETSGR